MLKTKMITVDTQRTSSSLNLANVDDVYTGEEVDKYINEWIERNNITNIHNISFNSFYDEDNGDLIEQALILYDDGFADEKIGY